MAVSSRAAFKARKSQQVAALLRVVGVVVRIPATVTWVSS